MNTLNRNEGLSYPTEGEIDLQSIMRKVYIWMGLGMLFTPGVDYLTVSTALINLAANPIILLVAIVAEFGLVLGISFGFSRLSSGVAAVLFFAYAALNGFTLSMVLLAFSLGSVFAAFVSTAALFGAMTILGCIAKMDLSKMGTYLMMGVIGLMIAMVVNMFVSRGPLDMLISMAGADFLSS